MAAAFQATTPPPSTAMHTPSTPRWGYDDDYQPYSPRKSARVMQRSRDAKTPPPAGRRASKRTSASASCRSGSPSSPQTATKKRAPQDYASERRVSGALTYDTTLSAASSLGIATPSTVTRKSTSAQSRSASRRSNDTMLPTPAKTPVDRPKHFDPAVRSVARTLFPVRAGSDGEVMPTPKRGKSKARMFSLDVEEDVEIPIYTDSRERVPEADLSADNPFYSTSAFPAPGPEPMKSALDKRKKIMVPGEGELPIEEVEQRTDGCIYVFRGKKLFRKFMDAGGEAAGPADEYESDVQDEGFTTDLRRPLTRSTIKPRLLFPNDDQVRAKAARDSHNTEDEEADTDIEDLAGASTPFAQIDDVPATPKAPRFGPFGQIDGVAATQTTAARTAATPKALRFGPITPPTTARTTRSKHVEMSNSAADPTSDDESFPTSPMLRSHRSFSGAVNPFDQSQEVKKAKSTGGRGKKRERDGEGLIRGVEKKTRSHGHIA